MIFSIEEEDQPLIDYYDVYYGSPQQAQNLAVDIKRIRLYNDKRPPPSAKIRQN